MHYPPGNYRNRIIRKNGLGFIGPPGAPQVTTGGVPIVGYTSGSGWAARPIHATGYYQPTVVPTGPVPPPQYDSGVPPPIYQPEQPFTYTREQLQQMIDRVRAAEGELTSRQERERGDGIYGDLEQKAAEQNATEKAIEDSAGVPFARGEGETPNWIPLALGAALIYFMTA